MTMKAYDQRRLERDKQYAIILTDSSAETMRRLQFASNDEDRHTIIRNMLAYERECQRIESYDDDDFDQINVLSEINSALSVNQLFEDSRYEFREVLPFHIPAHLYDQSHFESEYEELYQNYNVHRFFDDPYIQTQWLELLDYKNPKNHWNSTLMIEIHSNLLLPLHTLLEHRITHDSEADLHTFIDQNEDALMTLCDTLEKRKFTDAYAFYAPHFQGGIKALRDTHLELKAKMISSKKAHNRKHTFDSDISI